MKFNRFFSSGGWSVRATDEQVGVVDYRCFEGFDFFRASVFSFLPLPLLNVGPRLGTIFSFLRPLSAFRRAVDILFFPLPGLCATLLSLCWGELWFAYLQICLLFSPLRSSKLLT